MTGLTFGVLLMTVVVATSLLPTSFADHIDVTVDIPGGTSIPGCEVTASGCFVPSLVTVDVGSTVTWINSDTASHTVTSSSIDGGQDGLFDSGILQAGESFSVTFDGYEPGAYQYFCLVHPWKTGIVVVSGSDVTGSVSSQNGPHATVPEADCAIGNCRGEYYFQWRLEDRGRASDPQRQNPHHGRCVPGSGDILTAGMTDGSGEFSASWVAEYRVGGGPYDIYAIYMGSERFDGSKSLAYDLSISDPVYGGPTRLYLEPIPPRVWIGDTVTFRGVLEAADGHPVPNAKIYIKDDIFGLPDINRLTAVTDKNGSFSKTWVAKIRANGGAYDFYAEFKGFDQFDPDKTKNHSVKVSYHGGSISLDPVPSSAGVGERVDFSGTLILNGASTEGAVVYIKDEDTGSRDELLATAYVGNDGRFSTYWFATYTDFGDNVVDIFAVFEGDEYTARQTTCGFLCKSTESLRISGTQPPSATSPTQPPISTLPIQPPSSLTPSLPPSSPPDGWVARDGYMKMYYAMDLSSNPRVGIVPDPGSYDEVKSHIVPIQEGIMMWKSGLEERYGGSWDIDFEVVEPGTRFDAKPDVIINLITPGHDARCDDVFGWARVSSPVPPIQAHVCSNHQGEKRSNADVMATAAHEFIHAVGLGHTFGKPGDRMCSVENGIDTCPSSSPKSRTLSVLNLDAVAEIYGADGFKNPNNRFERGHKFYAVERGSISDSSGIQNNPAAPILLTPEDGRPVGTVSGSTPTPEDGRPVGTVSGSTPTPEDGRPVGTVSGSTPTPEDGRPVGTVSGSTPTPSMEPIPETDATSFQTFRMPEFSIRHSSDWDVDDEVIDLGTNLGMWESATSFVAFYDDAGDAVLEVVLYEEDDNAINNRDEAYLDRLEDRLRQECRQASYEYEGFECSNYSLTDSQMGWGAGGVLYHVAETRTETYPSGESFDVTGSHTSIPVGRNAWTVYSFTATDVFSQHSSAINVMHTSFKPTGVVEEDVVEEDVVKDKPEMPSGGGCLIATATYGSELAPQVQFLREIRDNTLLPTDSGASFMAGFNQFYYSFSPAVADLAHENAVLRDAVRVAITPALYTLNIMALADQNSDVSVIAFGLLTITTMAGIYVVGPVLAVRTISRKARHA